MGHAVALRSLRLFSAINLVEAELGWEIESVRSLDFFQPQIAGLDVFQFQNGVNDVWVLHFLESP